jgi:hypothetical protein
MLVRLKLPIFRNIINLSKLLQFDRITTTRLHLLNSLASIHQTIFILVSL